MHPDIQSLLDLQADDLVIADLEGRINALAPRMQELDVRRTALIASLAQCQHSVEVEEKRRGELLGRIAGHKQLQDRNLSQLDSIRKMKEATAAMTQVEVTRKIIADEEAEVATIGRRLTELRQTAERHTESLAALEQEQLEIRASIADERAVLDAELSRAKEDRRVKASRVARPLLGKYDRIRGRRTFAVYALREHSCGNCDTAIPLQRRNVMLTSGAIDVCEGCGVLLYSVDAT